ncbi:hypothetical protein GMMP13_390017 [Candidatus Magnetomoraceae bacterium gMMP-13]
MNQFTDWSFSLLHSFGVNSPIDLVIGAIVGGIISFIITLLFHIISSKSLKEQLKGLNELLQEHRKYVKMNPKISNPDKSSVLERSNAEDLSLEDQELIFQSLKSAKSN